MNTMTTLADYVAGADEEARIMWANECYAVPTDIRRIMTNDDRENLR